MALLSRESDPVKGPPIDGGLPVTLPAAFDWSKKGSHDAGKFDVSWLAICVHRFGSALVSSVGVSIGPKSSFVAVCNVKYVRSLEHAWPRVCKQRPLSDWPRSIELIVKPSIQK